MKLNRVFIIFFLVVKSSIILYGQETSATVKDSADFDLGETMKKMFNTKIEMEVDKDLFKQMGNSMYISEKHNAVLMILAVPQSIETAAQHMEKQKKKDGYKEMSKGEYKVEGRRILFEKGRIKKNGKKMIVEMFAIESLPNTSIFLTGVYAPEHEDIFEPKIKLSVNSAKLATNP